MCRDPARGEGGADRGRAIGLKESERGVRTGRKTSQGIFAVGRRRGCNACVSASHQSEPVFSGGKRQGPDEHLRKYPK